MGRRLGRIHCVKEHIIMRITDSQRYLRRGVSKGLSSVVLKAEQQASVLGRALAGYIQGW